MRWRLRPLAPVVVAISSLTLGSAMAGGAPPKAARLAASTGAGGASGTVWLCRPGQAPDPCTSNIDTTVVNANRSTSVIEATAQTNSHFACFYVYPTASNQKTTNANLTVQKPEIDAAEAEAAQFSQDCEIWAPMYRQRTISSVVNASGGINNDPAADTVAYDSLLSGWKDFLATQDDGRPFILLGHSQGAAMLIRLIRNEIDPNASLRSKMVVAIIAGGNVTVATGKRTGGSFSHVPTCASVTSTGCVIAYSSFPSEPPSNADFGRPGQGVSLQSGQSAKKGVAVACVNPAALSGGTGGLLPYFPVPPREAAKVSTPWVSFPGLYTAACKSGGGATWLQVTSQKRPGDRRPVITQSDGPRWGYHGVDINLALGNLVHDVQVQEGAYHPSG